jgi:hypothetical protein
MCDVQDIVAARQHFLRHVHSRDALEYEGKWFGRFVGY